MVPDEVKDCRFTFRQPDGSDAIQECEYKVSKDHRDNKAGKSHWTVSPDKELECFEKNYEEHWGSISCGEKSTDKAFGALIENGTAIILGKNRFDEDVRIARFKVYDQTEGQLKRQWHGYPSCYWRLDQDIPEDDFLRKFVRQNIISEANLKKIIRGQRCKSL